METRLTHCLDAAEEAFEVWSLASRHTRRALLAAWEDAYREAAEDLAQGITRETGKPITLARAEVKRGGITLQATIEALATFGEEAVPYDLMPGAEGCRATLRHFPRGPLLAITPFNFPVNLALHKLAPALACGCSVIWKPCPQAPQTSARLLESFTQARLRCGAPEQLIQMAMVEPAQAEALALNRRVKVVSFTGSERVGMRLRQIVAGKPLLLELGGNAAVVLDEGVDPRRAAAALAPATMAAGGQSCSKPQRFYIHANLWGMFVPAFLEAVRALPVGDPLDPETLVGPLVSADEACRLDAHLDRAEEAGARVLLRGERQGALLPPAVLADLSDSDPLQTEEAFGPIAVLNRVESFEEGLDRAAATRFGLRASAYSRDSAHLRLAEQRLRAGGVLLNLPPTFRLDSAPFGGLGASGQGFEGPRWAMEAFTEGRLIVEGPPL